MAQSVDTKIVELKFNNDNFADKVDSTLTKLEQLNKDIKEVGLTDALKNLSKETKKVDTSGITKSVEETTKSFSKLEVAGITAVANISNSIVNLGKKMAKSLITPLTQGVIQGGLSRARNIEQATFQFEGMGIGKSEGHEDLSYYHEVMEAVLGTSYSYDVAAKAASQLAASNIGVADSTKKLADGTTKSTKVLTGDMTKALLGIAGVASMTGADFDSIAQIFTRVAGQGKVMAVDLNSIAARGLNAAAVLAESLNTTEADIRDMVSKGKISFEEFSKAMSDAYGMHAKDSTLMFQGALDDVNAALARIGADFYGPALKAGRDILNSITPVVDAIHNKLAGALEKTNNLMSVGSKKMSQYFDMLAYIIERFPKDGKSMQDWVKEHMNSWTNITDLYKRGDVAKAISGLNKYMKTVDGMDGEGINGWKMLADYFNTNIKSVKEMVKAGEIGFNDFYKAFKKLWGESDKLMNIPGITEAFDKYVRACIYATKPTEEFKRHIETIFKIFHGIQSLSGSFFKIFESLADIFLTIAPHLAPLGNLLIDVVKEVASFTVWLADAIATSKHFASILDSIVSMLEKMFEVLHLDKMASAALMGIVKVFDFLAKAIEKLQEGAAKVFAVISKYFNIIVDKIYGLITDIDALRELANQLRKAGIIVALINLVSYITKPAQMLDALSKSIGNVGKSFSGMIKNIGNVFSEIAGLAGKIGSVLTELTNALKRMQELIVATAILEIAIAIVVLAGALYALSKIDWGSLEKSGPIIFSFLSIVAVIFGAKKIFGTLKSSVKIWERSINSMKEVGFAVLEFAVAVAIIAGAVKALSTIDTKSLYTAVGAVEILLITLAVIAKMLSNTVTKDTGLKALWSGKKTTQNMTKGILGLVAMAEAVNILAKAMVSMASIQNPDQLYNALIVVEALLFSMTAITKVLSGEKAAKMTKGIGALLAMAVAIRLLTKPITELASIDPTLMWNAVGAIMGIMLALSIMTQMMSGSKGMIKVGIGILLVAAAIKVLQSVVVAFAELDPEAMTHGILGVVGLIGGLTLALNFLDVEGFLSKAIGLVLIAHMLKELQDVVMTFGKNFDSAIKGLFGIGVALTGLLFAVYAFEAAPIGGILKLFGALILGAVVVAAFGAAIGVFGIGVGVFGVGLQVMAAGVAEASAVSGPLIAIMVGFAIAVGLLSTVGLPAIGVIIGIALAFVLLGVGIANVGKGMEDIAMSIKLIEEMKGELGSLSFMIISFIKDLKKLTNDAKDVGESFTSMAEPLASMQESITALNENVDGLITSYERLQTDTVNCIQVLADSLTTLSQLNQDSFAQATDAVSAFITQLTSMSDDAVIVSASAADISTSIQTLNTTVQDALNTFALFQQHVRVFNAIGESLNSIAEPINILNNLKGELAGLSEDLIGFVAELKTMKEDAASVNESATLIADSLTDIGESAKMATDNFAYFTKSTANTLAKIGDALNSIASGAKKLSKNAKGLGKAGEEVEEFYTKLAAVNETAEEIASGTTKVASALKQLINVASKSIDLTSMVNPGQKLVDSLIIGMNSRSDNVGTKVVGIVNSANGKVRARRSAFHSAGSYLIGGLIAGMESQRRSLEATVASLEATMEKVIKLKAEISSPSRVWMRIGAYMGEGLAIGVAKSSDRVKKASIGLASVSEDAVSSAIRSISGAIDDGWDIDPVITPVVDLSNVNRSSRAINSAFGSRSIGVSATGTRLASSVNGLLQNGGKNGLDYKLSALTKSLNGVTDSMNSRTQTNYFTIDGADDPMLVANQIVRKLKLNARTT